MTAAERANAIIGRLVRKGLQKHVHRILEPLFEACKEELEALEKERDAYKRAKAENDERFMIERDEARNELKALKERRAHDNPCVDHCNCQPRWQMAYVGELVKREDLEKANTRREERSSKLSHLHKLVTAYSVTHGGTFLNSAVQALMEGGDKDGPHRTGVFRQRSREEGQAAALSTVCYAAMCAINREDGRTSCSEGQKAWHALKEAHEEFGIEGNRSINLAELPL